MDLSAREYILYSVLKYKCRKGHNKNGRLQHNNYKEIDINNEEYIEEIKKLL